MLRIIHGVMDHHAEEWGDAAEYKIQNPCDKQVEESAAD